VTSSHLAPAPAPPPVSPEATPGEGGGSDGASLVLAAAALAVDPVGLGGAVLQGPPGPVRDGWLALLTSLLPQGTPQRRLPPGTTADRLLGGLDLASTVQSGRKVTRPGLLAESHGGLLVVPMAERLAPGDAAAIMGTLDTGTVVSEREGMSGRHPARFLLALLDESEPDESPPPPGLQDRLAFLLPLPPRWDRDLLADAPAPAQVAEARERLAAVELPPGSLEALTATSAALGIASLRPPLLALRAARALAALAGRVDAGELELAARLVLAPRALRVPPLPEEDSDPAPTPPPPEGQEHEAPPGEREEALEDRVLEAVRAVLPAGLLDALTQRAGAHRRGEAGRRGKEVRQPRHGRTVGSRPGDPRRGGRLDLLGTIRAAAPWQPLREREAQPHSGMNGPGRRLHIRSSDFRLRVLARKGSTTTIFVVDASGSQALNRLAEAKGAVELLLAESYVRREEVALVAFRGTGAELVLPPTRSLVRAKRTLAGLPGGGGTPLAAGIDAGALLAERVRRDGSTPVLVLLTDARANVARDGRGGRGRAEEEARGAGRRLGALGVASLVVDSSPRGTPFARELAGLMGGEYLPLPISDPRTITAAVRATGVMEG